jgi:hypothetical protein
VSGELIDKAPVYLSMREARAITRLAGQVCDDEACGDGACIDIRRTVAAVKRLIAKLALVRAALDSEVKE